MDSLVQNTKAWVPVSVEKSRLLRPSVPDRILQPRPVLTFRTGDDGTQEVKCRCTLQGFEDPAVLDLVRDRKTELYVLCEWSRDNFAVDCLVSFSVDNRRREVSILAG